MGQATSKQAGRRSSLLTPSMYDLQEMAERYAVDLLHRAPPMKNNCIIKKYRTPYSVSELKLTYLWNDLIPVHGEPVYYDFNEGNGLSAVTLMKSHFDNNSSSDQMQNFVANKSTRCSASITLVRALSVGSDTDVSLQVPDEVQVETTEFGEAISINSIQDSTKLDSKMYWHVNHPVKMLPFSSLTAEMTVLERHVAAWFSVQSTLSGQVVVVVTDPKNNQLVKVLEIDIASIVKHSMEVKPSLHEEYHGYLSVDRPRYTGCNEEFSWDMSTNTVKFTTKGYCSFDYGVEQYVRMDSNDMEQNNLEQQSNDDTGKKTVIDIKTV